MEMGGVGAIANAWASLMAQGRQTRRSASGEVAASALNEPIGPVAVGLDLGVHYLILYCKFDSGPTQRCNFHSLTSTRSDWVHV